MEQLTAVIPLNNSVVNSGADTAPLTSSSGQSPVIVNFGNDILNGGKSPANIDNRRILEVTGQGEVSVPTTITEVELGIQVQKPTASEVQQEVAQRSTAVVDVLQKLGAQKLQTTQIQLNPVYSSQNDTQTLTGFEGRNTLQFQLPTNQAGSAIDTAIQAGANLVQSISFTASDTALQQARLVAISEAVQDAQTQANVVFNTLQLAPGEIIDIDINAANIPTPSPLPFNGFAAQAVGAITPILGGPQTVQASVSLDILYSSKPATTLNTASDSTLADLSIPSIPLLPSTSATLGSDISNIRFDPLSSMINPSTTSLTPGVTNSNPLTNGLLNESTFNAL